MLNHDQSDTGESPSPVNFLPLSATFSEPNPADPQAFSDAHKIVVIRDDDAVNTGCCWWGAVHADPVAVQTAYEESGGTVSAIYTPEEYQ